MCEDVLSSSSNQRTWCKGSYCSGGSYSYPTCTSCNGNKTVNCSTCRGNKVVNCSNCKGEGKVTCALCSGSPACKGKYTTFVKKTPTTYAMRTKFLLFELSHQSF